MKDKCIFALIFTERNKEDFIHKSRPCRSIDKNIDIEGYSYKKELSNALAYPYSVYQIKEVTKEEFETKSPLSEKTMLNLELNRFFFAYVYDKTL